MTIKGTLETFNLRELLQMLSFNQKVGTLVLTTERGPQTVYVDKGRVTFVQGDPDADRALLRVIHRQGFVPPDRLQRALRINETTGRYMGAVLAELGPGDAEDLDYAGRLAAHERFLTLQLTSVSHFEFVDGSCVAPDGSEAEPIDPPLIVDSLLLDLTRKMDQWAELARFVPGLNEVYEITGVEYDLAQLMKDKELDGHLADRVVAAYDGYRTLDQVVAVSLADELTVVEVTGALVEIGALHPVPTMDLLSRGEDLLSRGDAQQSLPLLRRAVEREDASSDARIRLADAFEGTGDKTAAAVELDTYVALAQDAQPRDIFDAIYRALVLRNGDMATAARLCDHYLRNRPWLEERREQALDGLRHLIHGAVTSRRPVDAAQRLAEFIQHGDSPSEDLLVLADLYASGGDRTEAATALFRRAEDLLVAGRIAQGRELLERTVQLDPSRADARSRLHSLMGQDRRKRRRRRLFVFMVLMGLLLLGAGGAWWAYNQEANRAVRGVRDLAEQAVDGAESQAYVLLAAFETKLKTAQGGTAPEEGLAEAASTMVQNVRVALAKADSAIYAFASELENYQATDHRDAHAMMLRQLEARREKAQRRAEEIVDAARSRGRAALVEGEEAHGEGRFAEARQLLRTAQFLSFDDAAISSRAATLLHHVDLYIERFEALRRDLETARAGGDIDQAYVLGTELLREMLDSSLTRSVRLPIRVDSDPQGAEVRLPGVPAETRTPCTIEYSPFAATDLALRLPGRVPQQIRLPSYDMLIDENSERAAWKPHIQVTLASGPAWHIDASEGPFGEIWNAAGVPVLLSEDGATIQTIDVDAGGAGQRVSVRQASPVRLGGTFKNNVEWRIVGSRTLVIRVPEGEAWETQVLGHLRRAPILQDGNVILVDELGTVYGFAVRSGEERWREILESPPCQAPVPSALGILVATLGGGVFVLDPATGQRSKVAVDTRGLAYALPCGDDMLVVGGTGREIRRVMADGTSTVLGTAQPSKRGAPWTSADGVAWIEDDGVRWFPADGDAPIRVTGLGTEVSALVGDGRVLYAAGLDGVMRAAPLDDPTRGLWAAKVGTRIVGTPLPQGSFLFVLADGGLAAVAR